MTTRKVPSRISCLRVAISFLTSSGSFLSQPWYGARNEPPLPKQVISLVKAGVFSAQDFGQFSYMGKGGSFLAPYHGWDKKLSDDIKMMVAARKQEILDGTFRITIDESAPKSE